MRQSHEAHRRALNRDDSASAAHNASPRKTISLSEVHQATGIATETITQWEDAEHLFTTPRSHTGQRQYSDELIQRLLTIKKLVEQGMPMYHIHLFIDELAHAVARARLDAPRPQPHPLATTQKFLSVLRRVDAEIFAQLVTLSHDARSTPSDAMALIQRELAIVQPTFGAHRLLFWLRLPDGTWPVTETTLSPTQQRRFAHHATTAIQSGKVITRVVSKGNEVTIAPVIIDAEQQSVLMVVRAAEQALDKSEQAALEYIAQRLTQFYHAVRCWMNDRREWSFLRQLLNEMPHPIIMRDVQGKVVYFNKSAEELAQNVDELRHARANHLPMPPPLWDSAFPDGTRLTPANVPSLQALSTREIIRDMQMKIKTSEDGEDAPGAFWPALATAVPLFDEDDQLAFSVTILQDMSTPAQIQHLKNNVLEQVQHQIHNGLTASRGYAQLIQRQILQMLASTDVAFNRKMLNELHDYARIIAGQTRVIEKWTYELNDLEKQALGKPESCSLTYLVNECIMEMRPLHPAYHLTYEVDAGDALLEGQWVPNDIRFIITNLLSNAIKYSPPQSSVSVFLSRGTLAGKDIAKMVVRDQGQGIPPDQYEFIFEKGARIEQRDVHGNPIPGMGHGLSLCRILTMRYGGKLYPTPSKAGPGTDFTMKLQLKP
ncbi:MAG: MerR family transcriptional regulator [Ktedonobacterales bacterium]|nr:MerR family transcriptional regulator [Ktedonobacterales bacterium]